MCGRYMRRYHEYQLRSGFADDPAGDFMAFPDGGEYRVSDGERESVLAQLRRHAIDGRLTVPEFSQRTDEALAAQTTGQLRAALRDLPPLTGPSLRQAGWAPPFLPIVLAVLVVAFIMPALLVGHVWILFPLAWFAFFALRPRRRRRARARML